MVDYARARASAVRGIRGSGRTVSLARLPSTAGTPGKPLHGPAEPDEENPIDRIDGLYATFVDMGMGTLGIDAVSLDLFKNCDKVALVEPPENGAELIDYHVLIDGAQHWFIRRIQELKPGDTTILYYVGVSRTRVVNQ
jgi:hypothetical protein